MKPESIAFLEENAGRYQKLISTPNINDIITGGHIQAMNPERMLAIMQEVRPTFTADISNPVIALQVILDVYSAYKRLVFF